MDTRLKKIEDAIISIDKTLIKQHYELKEHIKRSDNNEKAIEVLKDQVAQFKGMERLLLGLSLIATVAMAFIMLFKK